MKRGLHILIILLVIVFVLIITPNITKAIIVTGKIITGETVTGDATQPVSMNITVTAPPALTILSPENKTYLTNESILLNYSVSGENSVWYNLDNLANTTITSSLYFNTSQGSHTLYLYANNDEGNTTKSVDFTVNITMFVIIDDEFEEDSDDGENQGIMKRNAKKGASTDFLDYSYEELQNLTGVILENTDYGKILFNEAINLTDDENPDDNILDINSHINLSFNRIEINSSALPNFNKSATLSLYNLTFSTPRILKDGEVCPSSICTQNSYSGGTLSFNVTGFSIYSAEETLTSGETPYVTPTGGGGGEVTQKKLKFEVEPELIKVTIKKGEIFKSAIKIKNTDSKIQEFKIEAIALEEFVIIPESEFSINPKEEKEISLIFSSPEDTKEDTYTGKIKISTTKEEKEISVILGIKSKIVLFDITLSIPPEYKNIQPGEELKFDVSLFNLGEIGETEVEVNYYIKDFDGNIIVEQQETVTVKTQASFSRTIELPVGIKEGQYVLGANIIYASSVGTASDVFYVGEVEVSIIDKSPIILIILIIVCILIAIFIISYFNKRTKEISKTYQEGLNKMEERIKKGNVKIVEATKIQEKLNSQLSTLYKSYKRGFISKQSYKNGKSKIEKTLRNLKRNVYK